MVGRFKHNSITELKCDLFFTRYHTEQRLLNNNDFEIFIFLFHLQEYKYKFIGFYEVH